MDGIILGCGILLTAFTFPLLGWFVLLVPYLLVHFFLFCNTFRLGGERSLIWIALLFANIYIWAASLDFWIPFSLQLLVTLGLILHCVLGKHYHGLACAQINPNGFRAGAMKEGEFTRRILLACRVPRPIIERLIGRRLDEFET